MEDTEQEGLFHQALGSLPFFLSGSQKNHWNLNWSGEEKRQARGMCFHLDVKGENFPSRTPHCPEGLLALSRYWRSRCEVRTWGTRPDQTSLGLRGRSRVYHLDSRLLCWGCALRPAARTTQMVSACCLSKLLFQRVAMQGRRPQNSPAFLLCWVLVKQQILMSSL